MTILDYFDLEKRSMISLVGGGGKTTSMFKMAGELKDLGYSVLLTTTTAILDPREESYSSDYFYLGEIEEGFRPVKPSITVYGDRLEGKKLRGGDWVFLDRLMEEEVFDFILIEADGARNLPIKAPKEGEPVIPSQNTHTLGIIGLDALGKRLGDIVHRPEYFKKIVGGNNLDRELSLGDMEKLILDGRGLFKEALGEKIVFLNKANSQDRIDQAMKLRSNLAEKGFKNKVLIGDMKTGSFY